MFFRQPQDDRDEEVKQVGVHFCKFVTFLIRSLRIKMNKYKLSQNRDFFLLLVKGLVDDRKKVDFLKSPLIRQLTLEFGWQSAVQGSEKNKTSHLQFVLCNPGRKFQHSLMKSRSMPEECVCKADENLMGILPGRL